MVHLTLNASVDVVSVVVVVVFGWLGCCWTDVWWAHQRFVIPSVHLHVCLSNASCLFAFTCTRMHFAAAAVVVVACGAVVNVAHVVYVTFLIPTLQRRTFSTINAHLSYTCINCRVAELPDQGTISEFEVKQQDTRQPESVLQLPANLIIHTHSLSLSLSLSHCPSLFLSPHPSLPLSFCRQSIAYKALNLTQLDSHMSILSFDTLVCITSRV